MVAGFLPEFHKQCEAPGSPSRAGHNLFAPHIASRLSWSSEKSVIGSRLNHYMIEESLGKGGMGEVYIATDLNLRRKVALKVLSSQMAMHAEHRRRFEREARAVAALNHPNIVTIYSVEEADGVHFITMELVDGRPLSELIPADGFSFDRLIEIAIPLTDAVSAAHKAGITHRDLKPENIMVTGEGRVKVLDFGLAKLREAASDDPESTMADRANMTETGKILGTVAFMSPEQAEGKEIGPQSDVFSLGIVLYTMATGGKPFKGDSHISTILSIVRDSPPEVEVVNPKQPSAFSALVERCLEKKPDNRFPSASELRDALRRISDGATTGSQPTVATKSLPSRPVFWLGLVVVAAIALWGWSVVRQGRRAADPEAHSTRSIAVLPFHNLSGGEETDYFSDGVTAEITSKLSRIKNLDVTSLTSAARFRETTDDIRVIGQELGVRYLLEGTVRKGGSRVRITTQLIDARNGFQLWSEDFEGQLDDVFGVQERTALQIAQALDLRLSPSEQEAVLRRFTANPQAYDAYLRGRALLEYFSTPEKLVDAGHYFERALELDPDYTLALVGLSRVEAQWYRNLDPSEQRLQRAERLALRAIELEPQLAEAHLAMGQVLANQYRYSDAAARFRQALRIDPNNAYAWDLLSWALAYQQPPDPAAAEEAARKSISLQASLIGAHYHLGRALLLQGRYQEARAAFTQAKNLDPEFETADYGIAQVLIAQGQYREALGYLLALKEIAKSPVVDVQTAAAHEALGEHDLALQALDKALSNGYVDLDGLEEIHEFDTLREDPRYVELLRRNGLLD